MPRLLEHSDTCPTVPQKHLSRIKELYFLVAIGLRTSLLIMETVLDRPKATRMGPNVLDLGLHAIRTLLTSKLVSSFARRSTLPTTLPSGNASTFLSAWTYKFINFGHAYDRLPVGPFHFECRGKLCIIHTGFCHGH